MCSLFLQRVEYDPFMSCGSYPHTPTSSTPTHQIVMAARRMHARLPSISGEFRQSVPLTRIRDIAHRGDIPHDIKQEIKHTLQNKLHRCAGEEWIRMRVFTERKWSEIKRLMVIPHAHTHILSLSLSLITYPHGPPEPILLLSLPLTSSYLLSSPLTPFSFSLFPLQAPRT